MILSQSAKAVWLGLAAANKMEQFLFVLFIASSFITVHSVELTFELEDNARECFHETIVNKTKCTLEFQVVTGGHYDVDVIVKDPHGKILYDEKKKQYDSVNFDAEVLGEYEFCFSNEFSSYSHKTIYMDFQDGSKEPPLPIGRGRGMDEGQYSLTLIESSAVQIHESLNTIIDYQTHHRLREAKSRSLAEYIFERVNYWSIGQTLIMLGMSLLQVFTLKRLFTEKRDRI
ncbi:transmembrane emp24 domain-containing protein 3-like isoform X1 [Clytia hemisphaerica]|uniref:GOLD domain-containing protein n=1 Tax=Clytia hemisphaerica TaxID=252671 RepID=A0A7M5WYM4_9CNID|eukprot:TCONS_00014648-protein